MTHQANIVALKHLKPEFDNQRLSEIDADQIEGYLRSRLRQRNRVRTVTGYRELGIVKPTTVHQEFRVLRRIFSVAVKKKLCPVNPCSAVEFPTSLKGLFRPHRVSWSEQQRIESHAPRYHVSVIRIITETGLRVYKDWRRCAKTKWAWRTRSHGFLNPRHPMASRKCLLLKSQ